MTDSLTRRDMIKATAGTAALALAGRTFGEPAQLPQAPPHELTTIFGTPRERGRQYGRRFEKQIHAFLEREIYKPFVLDTQSKDRLLAYGGACTRDVEAYSPEIMAELEGVAEATGLRVEELVLITLHEELYHQGKLPTTGRIQHCTAVAMGPPDTADGDTYVGQTWDWMPSVFGLSTLLMWKREEGPDLLGYAYPGLWAGAGLNSAGIALTWTSAQDSDGIKGPRVGIPSYILIVQMLYQSTLEAAIEEARRATHAGWFTFVLADGDGNIANVEGSPRELAVETNRGTLARAYYGTRKMTKTPEGEPVRYGERCRRMYDLLATKKGELGPAALKRFFLDPELGIYNRHMTVDAFIFNATKRTCDITRGLGSSGDWNTFAIEADRPQTPSAK